MKIGIVEKIADLAKISLGESEKEQYAKEFTEILEAFEIIKQLDTKDTKPSFQPIQQYGILREDIIEESHKPKIIIGPRTI